MSTVKRIVEVLGVGAALLLFFEYVAGFALRQSFFLAIVCGLVYESLKAVQPARRSFRPYSVLVIPKISKLLLDLRLLKDAAESEHLQQLWESGKATGDPQIWFTVLQPADGVHLPGLTYWEGRQSFRTELDFSEPIEGIEFRYFENPLKNESEDTVVFKDAVSLAEGSGFGAWSPEVYCRLASGYELGITVREEWWNQVCATDQFKYLADIDADTDQTTGETRLVVARLPCSEFAAYYQRAESNGERRKKRQQARDKELGQYGWKRVGTSSLWWTHEMLEEYGIPITWECIEHKYFIVGRREI